MRATLIARLLLSAALQMATAQPATAAAAGEVVHLEIVHLPREAGWEARYHWSTPAKQLKFRSDFGAARSSWQVRTPGLRLITGHAGDFLEAADGHLFKGVVLRFQSNILKPPHEYPLNLRFTDGSELLYQGHLYARPVRTIEAPLSYALTLRPRPGESIVTQGHCSSGAMRWTDTELRGTFAYFGKLAVLETPSAISVIDPGFPEALLTSFQKELPQLLEYFTQRMGIQLARRPQLFISYSPQGEGQGQSGDVLPGTIAFNFSGSAWSQRPQQRRAYVLQLIAHEVAHLWNGDAFNNAQGDVAPWLHEGGADALAWIALHELHLISSTDLFGAVSDALNSCIGIAGLGRRSLEQTAGSDYELAYSCGGLMYFLVHAELRERGGLLAFWRALFERASPKKRTYDVTAFFTTLQSLTVANELITALQSLWSGHDIDARGLVLHELARQQFTTVETTASSDYAAKLQSAALSRLMAQDCGGFYSF